ncbi:MAG TPA: hypothetical protein VFO09_08675, partial [Methyloceanibacter sp.]|nr:hypothetical protein [Methyloceanibacter sp.]
MIGYIRAHWHGELSLAQSYWLNVICLDLVLDRGMTLLERPIERQGIEKGAVIGLSLLVLLAVIWAWQSVGVWRSATNTSTRTGRAFWPRVAKVVTVLGIAAGTVGVVAGVWDITRSLAAIRDPDLAEYTIERVGDTDLVFTGAINDESVDDIIMALEGSPIEILRVNSLGGLMPPAMRLARHIRENQLMVMAEEECSSACVMLLAASPQAALWPGPTVTFH